MARTERYAFSAQYELCAFAQMRGDAELMAKRRIGGETVSILCGQMRPVINESLLEDLRAWNAIGMLLPVVVMATAARIQTSPGGQLLIKTGDAARIMHPVWRWIRIASLVASCLWCIFFSWGLVALAYFLGAFIATWVPGLLGLYGKVVRWVRPLDIVTLLAALIVWLGTFLP